MLHHVEPRLFYCLMHMFVIHKFDLVACLNLNRKEKTKAKGIRKFGLKEKAKSAQRPPPSWPFSPLGPVHPRAPVLHLPLTSGPALSALSLARPCAHASPGRASSWWPHPSVPLPVAHPRACATAQRALAASASPPSTACPSGPRACTPRPSCPRRLSMRNRRPDPLNPLHAPTSPALWQNRPDYSNLSA
jgi:hypothetical protein